MHLKQWRKTQFFVAKELQEALDFFSQDFFLWVLFRLITELQGWICVTGHLRSSNLHGSPSPLDAMQWLVWRVQSWGISTKSCDGLKTEGFWMISFQGYASLRCVPFLVYRDVLCFPKGTWRLETYQDQAPVGTSMLHAEFHGEKHRQPQGFVWVTPTTNVKPFIISVPWMTMFCIMSGNLQGTGQRLCIVINTTSTAPSGFRVSKRERMYGG